MRRRALCLMALLAPSIGCTPAGLWGNEARYAPDFRGYVVARSPDSAAVFLPRNPITGKKIRCREQLEPYFAAATRETVTAMHDERVAVSTTMPVKSSNSTWSSKNEHASCVSGSSKRPSVDHALP